MGSFPRSTAPIESIEGLPSMTFAQTNLLRNVFINEVCSLEASTPFVVHLEKIGNHLHLKSDNNAKICSIAPIGIQLRDMHPQQGYLHNCKHSIKSQDFHLRLAKFKLVKATFICAHCKFNNIKRIFFCVIGHSF